LKFVFAKPTGSNSMLRTKKIQEIAAAIQGSGLYAGFIRFGPTPPASRYWLAPAKLVRLQLE